MHRSTTSIDGEDGSPWSGREQWNVWNESHNPSPPLTLLTFNLWPVVELSPPPPISRTRYLRSRRALSLSLRAPVISLPGTASGVHLEHFFFRQPMSEAPRQGHDRNRFERV